MDAKVYKNSAILVLLRVIEPLLSLIVLTAISRSMGPETLGSYSFLLTYAGMISVFGQMGLSQLLTREIAKHKEAATTYLNSSVIIGLGTSLPAMLVLNLSDHFYQLTPEVRFCLILLSCSILPAFITAAFESVFMAFEQMELILYRRLVASLFRVTLMLLAVWQGYPLKYLVLIDVCNSVLSVFICAQAFHRRIARLHPNIDWANVVSLLRQSPAFFGLTVLTVLASRSDILVLARLSTMQEVAFYTLALKIYDVGVILPQAYVKAAFPRLSELFMSGSKASFQLVIQKLSVHVLAYSAIAACVLITIGPVALQLVFGERYAGSLNPLRLLSLGIIPYSVGRVLSTALTASNQQRFDLIAAICATTFILTMNVALVPRFGSIGTALAFSSTVTLGCSILAGCSIRTLGWNFMVRALKWSGGVVLAVSGLFWLALYHDVLATVAFGLVFVTGSAIYLLTNNRWKQVPSGVLMTCRNLMK
jgi:O-antigen/teichoic acid export membrane protein